MATVTVTDTRVKVWFEECVRRQQERNERRDSAATMAVVCDDWIEMEQLERRMKT